MTGVKKLVFWHWRASLFELGLEIRGLGCRLIDQVGDGGKVGADCGHGGGIEKNRDNVETPNGGIWWKAWMLDILPLQEANTRIEDGE